MNPYIPILGMVLLATLFVVVSMGLSAVVGPGRYNRAKYDSYECGIQPTPQPVGGGRFPVKYYITAMMFIVFDIEVVFLLPWAVAFNRQPHYGRGLVLVGDAGGMVNPFNGEGIPYAMESAEMAAEAIAEARSRGFGTASAEKAMRAYPERLKAELGGYYRLGTVFVKLIGDPRIMHLCTRYGLPRKTLMRFVLKLLANLTARNDGDAMDRIINALCKVAPSA